MVVANISVIAFATATGRLGSITPYISHNNVPIVNRIYIGREIPDVSLVSMVLMACGKNEAVVPNAARYPMMATKFVWCINVYYLPL
jgi:hypothetical protein